MARVRDTAEPRRPVIPVIPPWAVATVPGDAAGDVFTAGAVLGHLHGILAQDGVPAALFRERLALRAAEFCVLCSGGIERAADLRDAVCLAGPGDLPGPAGAVYHQWRRAVARPVSVGSLSRALGDVDAAEIADLLDGVDARGTPVDRAAAVLDAVLTGEPGAEIPALILAEASLALSLGWSHLVPVLTNGMGPRDLSARGPSLGHACHRAVARSVVEATRLAAELARRAHHLRSVAPKLRAKGADGAVEMFLTRDAVAPAGLPLPDRAARRLCDRLVDLGAVRELTGRATFRLYGI